MSSSPPDELHGGSFTYTIIDGFGGSATGTVTINDINTAPVGFSGGIVRTGRVQDP